MLILGLYDPADRVTCTSGTSLRRTQQDFARDTYLCERDMATEWVFRYRVRAANQSANFLAQYGFQEVGEVIH